MPLEPPHARPPSLRQVFADLGGAYAVNALIANNTPKAVQGSVYGINTSVNAAGMAIGPAIGATVAVWFGYSSAFFATAVVLAGGAVMVGILSREMALRREGGAPAAAARRRRRGR